VGLERLIRQSMQLPLMVLVAALEGDQFFLGLEVENQLMQFLIRSYFF
jgi:hypothetical protein